MSEPQQSPPVKAPFPAIPLLLFAAVDLFAAFFLLLDGGFTVHFVLIALVGLLLAAMGLVAVYRRPRPVE
jgi:hypothetical protein